MYWLLSTDTTISPGNLKIISSVGMEAYNSLSKIKDIGLIIHEICMTLKNHSFPIHFLFQGKTEPLHYKNGQKTMIFIYVTTHDLQVQCL